MSNRRATQTNQEGLSGKVFVISGPSGSGKTTLAVKAVSALGLRNRLVRSVSFTTRRRRPGEKEGRDYFFISRRQFEERRRKRKVLEWTKYLGYYYATPGDFVERLLQQGKNVILCLDLNGARRIRHFYPARTVTVFIVPPTLDALRGRIEGLPREVANDPKVIEAYLGRKAQVT